MASTASLYDRIGGEPVLEQMVNDLYHRILADPELSHFFKSTPMERQRKMQKEFLRAALGQPSNYSGLALSYAHAKRGITVQHFNRFCQHMFEALSQLGIDDTTVQEVVSHMAIYKNDITGEAY